MKKMLCVVVALLSLLCFSCGKGGSVKTKRTYLIYMDSAEGNAEAVNGDIAELKRARISADSNVFLLINGSFSGSEGLLPGIIYEIKKGSAEPVENRELYSGKTAPSLKDFIIWVADNREGTEYDLFLCNTEGSLPGSESFADISQQVKEGCGQSGVKFGFAALDGGLCANLENAAAFADCAEYIVASQELTPECGFDFRAYFKAEKSKELSSADLPVILAKCSYKSAAKKYSSDFLTFSVIKTAEAENVAQLAEKETANKNFCSKELLLFGGKTKDEGFSNMTDILSLFGENKDLKNAVQSAVVYAKNGASCKNACGMSVYYPYYCDMNENEKQSYRSGCFSDVYAAAVAAIKGAGISSEEAEKLRYEIDGKVYDCVYCGEGLFYKYYSAFVKKENGKSVNYRIKVNRLSREAKVSHVVYSYDGKEGKVWGKYAMYGE